MFYKRKDYDSAWEAIFRSCHVFERIQRNGYCIVTAGDIHRIVPGYEPRNIARFASLKSTPKIFRENNLSILPTENGAYMIAPFMIFHELEKEDDEELLNWPIHQKLQSFESLQFEYNEATAVNLAYVSGILGDFLDDENIVPAICGRMHTSDFCFDVLLQNGKRMPVEAHHVQMEIDAAYEGDKYLSLIEAKNEGTREIVIRQLYYPYRTWKDRINKEIKNIFIVYRNSVFTMYQYRFAEPNYYNSITLEKHRIYKLIWTNKDGKDAISR